MNSLHSVIVVLAVVGVGSLWVGALLSIVRTASTRARTAVWSVVVVVFPIVGSLLWFWAGRPYERALRS